MGEWKNDKRCGFGISERSDGLKYEGEWFNNRKYGYGVTTFKDGSREEGKYKNNILITSNKKKHLFLIRSAKFRERIDSAVNAAQRASKIALQKADIAISRTATARGKAEQADYAAVCANEDSTEARTCASNFAPEFKQPDGQLVSQGALLSESGTSGPGARSSAHGPPPALKLELPGTGRAGPGPPSPRGAMAGGGPGPPSASPQPPMANHVSVMSKPQAPVPAPPSSLDVRSQNHVAPQPPAPAPAPAPKPLQPPPKASIAPPRNNPPVSPPPSASDRPSAPTIPLLSAPAPRTEVPQASHPDPAVLRQPQSLQPVAQPEPRGRTPTRQERSRLTAQNDNGAAPAAGGYNFQKIMDDRFEHYRGRPRGRGAKTLVVELPLVESPGAGTRVCREQAAGKGLQWSRALVTLNPRPGPLMASVWKATTQPRTGPGTARPMGQLVSTSNCPPRTRSGSEAFSKKSHISELRQRELRAST